PGPRPRPSSVSHPTRILGPPRCRTRPASSAHLGVAPRPSPGCAGTFLRRASPKGKERSQTPTGLTPCLSTDTVATATVLLVIGDGRQKMSQSQTGTDKGPGFVRTLGTFDAL